jgi:hypothetical protein
VTALEIKKLVQNVLEGQESGWAYRAQALIHMTDRKKVPGYVVAQELALRLALVWVKESPRL